jgi:DNA-binding ferritin-like protein (Dps family)
MSDVEKSGFISKMIGDKKRWGAYKARTRRLPENYRSVVEAIERCLMHFVPTDGDSAASMFEDLADLFEQAAADGSPIREIVGGDPLEFVEAFAKNYSQGGFITSRVRKQLIDAIDRAERDDAGTEDAPR